MGGKGIVSRRLFLFSRTRSIDIVGLTLEEVGDALTNSRDTVACAVGADGADLLQQPFGALNDVVVVAKRVLESLLVLQEQGVLNQAQDLAEEGDGLLVELLRVADVGRDDLGEGQARLAAAELGAELLRLDGQLAADGVLGLDDVGVDVALVQASGRGGRHVARRLLLVKVCSATIPSTNTKGPRGGRS